MSEPIHVIRFGLIKGEIFVRRSPSGDRFNVIITRLFRNGDSWSESKQFGRDDLLVVAKIADLAHSYIFQIAHGNKSRREEETDS